MIDAHIHLDEYKAEEIDQYILRWQEKGVKAVVAVSSNLASSYRIVELKKKYPDFIYAAIGFHPEQKQPTEKELMEWVQLLKIERASISAIGEIGLPHYELDRLGGQSYLQRYIPFLDYLVQIAVQEELPVLLHGVHDKVEPILEILIRNHVKKAHFHWLKAPLEMIKKIISRGYFISVTPEVCYRSRDQELLSAIPLSHLLLETDGPWSYQGPFIDRETEPLMVREIAAFVAQAKRTTPEKVIEICQSNVQRLFLCR